MKEKELLELIQNQKINNFKQLLTYNLASESTIRRHLKKLQNHGFITLTYGGGINLIPQKKISISDNSKINENTISKMKVAKKCAKLIHDGSIIFIDNGTTVRFILKNLINKNVVIYTNGFNHLKLPEAKLLNINLIPGQVLINEAAIVGEESLLFLANKKFDFVFIGANGFDHNAGITTPNYQEANLKTMALTRSENSYIVMTNDKEHKISQYKIAEYHQYPIITNEK